MAANPRVVLRCLEMPASLQSERIREPPQFTLALLMAWVFAACVMFGAGRLIFDQSLSMPLKMLLALGGWTIAVGIFAAVGQIKTVVEWGVLIVVGLIIAALLMPAVTFECRRRPVCMENLRQIGIALQAYHDNYQCFPPAYIADDRGRPMHSWRVLLLPFLDQRDLYAEYRFDEPWDGPHNSKLHDRVVANYRCPGGRDDPTSPNETDTCYVVVVGPHTAFPGDR